MFHRRKGIGDFGLGMPDAPANRRLFITRTLSMPIKEEPHTQQRMVREKKAVLNISYAPASFERLEATTPLFGMTPGCLSRTSH
jgi:hypothetical protein